MMGEFGSVINFLYCSGRAWALQVNPVRTSKKENIGKHQSGNYKPGSWEDPQQLIEWFKWRAKFKHYIQLSQILQV